MSDQVKLLFVIDCYRNPYAGTEGQLLKLLAGLDGARFDAELVVFRGSDYLAENRLPVPVTVLGIGRLLSPKSWLRLFRFFREKRNAGYRLAHIYFNDASIICPPILRLLGYRVIISRRDMGFWLNWFNLLPLRLNSLLVDRVTVNSVAVKDMTVAREWYARDRVEVIYNGYETAASTVPPDIETLLPPGVTLKLVVVANIRPIKRMQDAIHALARLRESSPDCVLYIIGDGNQSELAALCVDLGITEHVRFLGPRTDVASLLPAFDVGLLCSESEGFSNTLIEYLQAGLAVVCTDVGGNPEIIEHGITGLLYPAGDTDALAANLQRLVADPVIRAKLGQAGRERVRARFSIAQMVERYQHIYTGITGVA